MELVRDRENSPRRKSDMGMFVLTVLHSSDLCGVSVSSVHIEVRVEVCYIALMSSQLHIP